MTYHPDDDGGAREWDVLDEKRFTCCGGRDCHKIGCDFEDELPADPDDTEEEDEDYELPAGRGVAGEVSKQAGFHKHWSGGLLHKNGPAGSTGNTAPG